MPEPLAKYQSYLLRLWQDGPHAMWRGSAQCIQTSEIVHFADLDSLFTFLAAQTTSLASATGAQMHADDRLGNPKCEPIYETKTYLKSAEKHQLAHPKQGLT